MPTSESIRPGGVERRYRIRKRFTFEAAHHLPQLPASHKCSRQHGHGYVVEVTLAADHLDTNGFVLDYACLDTFKRVLDEEYDHRDLNELVPCSPTAEALAAWFYRIVSRLLEGHLEAGARRGLRVERVMVSETANTTAEYVP